jgi:predicted DNA-binding protein
MVRQDENTKSVRFTEAVDERLTLLARKLGRTKRQLVVQMVGYFYKSKKDPAHLNDEVLKKELANGISRILSFIRKQEGDLLVPMYSAMEELMAIAKMQNPLLKDIGEGRSEASIMGRETIGYLKLVDGTLKKILGSMREKEALKSRFRQILDHYITQRETLGWPVSAAKKEELAKHVRQSLDNL